MFKNHEWFVKTAGVFLFFGLLELLLFYFDSPIAKTGLPLLGGLASGLFLGLVIRLFSGYLKPNDWIYQYRYTIEGIGFGLLFASVILFINLADNQPFGAMDLVLPFILGLFFGAMWINTSKHKKLKNWTHRLAASHSETILCNDLGSLIDANNREKKGMIILTPDSILFKPFYDEHQKMKIDLSKVHPQLEKSWTGFFKTPSGIRLTNNWSIKPAKFPRYWFQKIKSRKTPL